MSQKIAIVTGGSSGIGRATCIASSKANYCIVVLGTNLQRINETLNLLPTSGHLGLSLDVTKEEAMTTMANKTIDYFSRTDLLVASAGLENLLQKGLYLIQRHRFLMMNGKQF